MRALTAHSKRSSVAVVQTTRETHLVSGVSRLVALSRDRLRNLRYHILTTTESPRVWPLSGTNQNSCEQSVFDSRAGTHNLPFPGLLVWARVAPLFVFPINDKSVTTTGNY